MSKNCSYINKKTPKNPSPKAFQRYLHSPALLHSLYNSYSVHKQATANAAKGNYRLVWNTEITDSPRQLLRKGFCVSHDKHWLYQGLIIGHCKCFQKFRFLELDELSLGKCSLARNCVTSNIICFK